MTKQHFEALADGLRIVKPHPGPGVHPMAYSTAMYTWQRTVKAVADVCAASNGNFDRGRFNAACGWS